MNFNNIPTSLDVSLYGKMEKVTDTMSKCRVRIFYKGMNRNRTFISEDFANQLISSLPYAPVKGIFDKDALDYTDHGEDNADGRIYGLVMAEPNFAWEDHEDIDGVVRSYACADVLIYTALYPEAKLILESSQSMEIYRNTLEGEWRISEDDNQPYFHFEKGCLVGLQVLGQSTEPCFEGSEFFSLKSAPIVSMVNYMNKNFIKEEAKMEHTLFKMSDSEKANAIATMLNPNFSEEKGWKMDKIVLDIYEDCVLCGDLETSTFQIIEYSVQDEAISLGKSTDVKIIGMTPTECAEYAKLKEFGTSAEISGKFAALEQLRTELDALKTASETDKTEFEKIQSELNEKISAYEAEKETFNTKEVEMTNTINDLTSKVEDFTSKIEAVESEKVEFEKQINDLKNENEELKAFKYNIEKNQKESILKQCEDSLSEEDTQNFVENMDSFSLDEFKKEVYLKAVESNPTIFSKAKEEPQVFYKGGKEFSMTKAPTSVEALIDKHKNGGNK